MFLSCSSSPNLTLTLCEEALSVPVSPYFAFLGLILVPLTFFWYGREKHPPTPPPIHSCCLLKQELQHASLPQHKLTLWPFSVLGIQGRDGTQDVHSRKLLSFPRQLFLSYLVPKYRSSDLKVKMGL